MSTFDDQVAAMKKVADDADAALAAAAAQAEDLNAQIEELQRQLDECNSNPPPASEYPLIGVSLDTQTYSDYTAFKANKPVVTGQRIFHSPGQLPATYQQSFAKDLQPPDLTVISFKPDIAAMTNGSASAWAKGFAESCPEGTLFICQHEPEQKSKNISPQAFTDATNRLMGDVGPDTPAVRAICLMEYQFNIQGDVYMKDIRPDAIDCITADFYIEANQNRAVADLFGPFFDAAKRLFPDHTFGVAEFGVSQASQVQDRAQYVIDSLAWLKANDVYVVDYYQTYIGNSADWALSEEDWARINEAVIG